MAYTAVKSKSDRIEGYAENKRKQLSDSQSEKGKLGGAPRGNQNARKQAKTTEGEAEQAETSQDNPEQAYTVSDSVSVSSPVSVSDSTSESEAKGKRESTKRTRRKPAQFIPPTLDEVREYCKNRNSPVDPVRFYEYFTSDDDPAKHWIDSNGKPVVNWKQKLITWETHNGGGTRASPSGEIGNVFADMARERRAQP
jgi:hypothetical protein